MFNVYIRNMHMHYVLYIMTTSWIFTEWGYTVHQVKQPLLCGKWSAQVTSMRFQNREWWNTKFLGLPLIPLKRCGPCLARGQWRSTLPPVWGTEETRLGTGQWVLWRADHLTKAWHQGGNINEQRWQGRGRWVTVLRSVSNGNFFFFLSHFICSRKIFLSKHLGSIGNFTPIIRTIRVCVWWLCYH